MKALLAIGAGIIAANIIGAFIGCNGLHKHIRNYYLLLIGWSVSAATAIIVYQSLL